MGLEATLICVDNSEWMRNGDFVPSRLQVQDDAVNAVCRMKTRQNVENSVGLLTLADSQVRVTLTNDPNKIFKALQSVEPKGDVNFITGIRIAHLALKHRQNRNQRIRIVAFIGSPIATDEKDMVRLAKRLKKEKVNMDIVNFGEDELNTDKLAKFIDTLNGKDQTSHLVTAHPGPLLSEVLLSSPILAGEDGAPLAPMGQGFEFGIDPTEDPELAMALRVSMEEQRQRQEEEARLTQHDTFPQGKESGEGLSTGDGILAQADMASLPYNPEDITGVQSSGVPDVSAMSEEQQLALAVQMSMAGTMEEEEVVVQMDTSNDAMQTASADGGPSGNGGGDGGGGGGVEVAVEGGGDDDDMSELIHNRDFLHSILSSLPGVNPEEALQNLEEMTEDQGKDSKRDEEEEEEETEKK